MVISTQGPQILVTLAAVGINVIHVSGFLWATATGAVLADVCALVAVAFQDPKPSPVPPGWKGGVPPTLHNGY